MNKFKEDMDYLDKLFIEIDPCIHEKSRIMAGMLNGTIDWNYGNYLRQKLDAEER